MNATVTTLSPSQQQAIDAITAWYRDPHGDQIFRMYGVAGTGKALRNGTMIPTPIGPIAIEDLKPGDHVFGPDGSPITITGVFPQGIRPGYRMTFRDGFTVNCDEGHLWQVRTNNTEKVLTTGEILAAGLRNSHGDTKFRIPLTEPVEYPHTDLLIHPYLLGALIGDGTSLGKTPTLCLGGQDADEIMSYIELPEWVAVTTDPMQRSSPRFRLADPRTYHGNGVAEELRRLGLGALKSPERFIPDEYLRASIAHRWLLLQGLMDTDGSCRGNRTSFATSSPRLAADVAQLVQSLGGTAIINPQRRGTEIQVNIKVWQNPFRLKRKAAKWAPSFKNPPSRYITSIEKIDDAEHTCISVAATNGLFLSEHYIVTHNTTIARTIPDALELPDGAVLYAALAGKAAMVLRSKGCLPASTLHKLAYTPAPTAEALAAALRADALRIRAEAGEPNLEAEILEAEREARKTEWALNVASPIAEASLLICDEVSMVGPVLGRDLESFGTKILVIGDPEQLPPVDGAGYWTSVAPDVMLSEIHRQALDSPVLELATRIRNGEGPVRGDYAKSPVNPASPSHMAAIAEHYDQVLVGRRKTRWSIIHGMRDAAGRTPGVPAPGDRVMCLANNTRLGIFNGQQFEVIEVAPIDRGWSLTVAHDDGGIQVLEAWGAGFEGEAGELFAARNGRERTAALTFAQCITVHKSQGSEWLRVLVIDESDVFAYHETKANGPDAGATLKRRWLYTSVTRASERATLVRIASR